jgi:solute:Na+ symporter, SSS family
MILIAALIVAVFTFSQAEIGGFTGLLALEAQLPAAEQKMHLYLPTSHPDLPWSGAFTGLVILHLFYWTTNQYLVQRTLAARSDSEARIGAIVAGFLKLGIPFFSIAAGVAAAHLFRSRPETQSVLPDDAFLRLVETVVPIGYGLTGFIMAGLAAATFSSIDSMMNSATTLVTLDIYKKYLRPDATEQQMVRSGRLTIVLLVILSAGLAMLTYDPTSAGNFFLRVSAQGSYLTQGVVVAFFMGIVWRRTNGRAAVITMLAAPLFAIAVEWLYNTHLHSVPALQSILGDRLNFLHRVLLTLVFCTFLLWGLSRWWSKPSVPAASAELQLTSYAGLFRWVAVFALLQVVFLTLIYSGMLGSATLAVPAGLATFTLFLAGMIIHRRTDVPCSGIRRFLTDDRLYAGLLTATAVWMLYAFA